MSKSKLLDLIKSIPGLRYLFQLSPDRHFADVPISVLQVHTDVLKLARAGDPKNVDLLKSSFKITGNEPLYAPVIYPEKQSDGSVALYIVDGHQRIRAERANDKERMIVQIVTLWNSINEAFEVSISANWARYAVDEKDVFSALTTGRVGKDTLVTLTGFSESKIDRLILISEHPALVPLVTEKLVGPSTMVTLIKACSSNPDKLSALITAMEEKRTIALEEARKWKDIIRTNKHIKYERRDKEKREPKTYFKNVDWETWEDALGDDLGESDRIVRRDDGSFMLKPEAGVDAKYVNIRLGDEDEWEKQVAIFGLSGVEHSKIDPTQLKTEILDHWDEIGDRLRLIYEEIAPINTRQSRKRTTSTPPARKVKSRPTKQKPNMNVVSTDDDDDLDDED